MHILHDPSAPKDFDFIMGQWHVKHRRLNASFARCTTWTEFDGLSEASKILGGFGNLEDHILHMPTGTFRAVAMRSFCSDTATWSIWWLDGRSPGQIDHPVVGAFANHRGLFFAEDVLEGRPIRVRFVWTVIPGQNPRWEQSFSDDAGKSWELNWTMEFTPVHAFQ